MENNDNGGPAFPVPYSNEADGPTMMPTAGMTLRDYAAIKALAALIQTEGLVAKDLETPKYVTYMAGAAYAMADAMLKARKKN